MENNSLTDIVKSRRESGEGVASSLVGGFKERLKEKFDPRRIIPQGGLLTSLFPKLTAYKAQKATSPTGKVVKLISSNLKSVAKSSNRIKSISKNISEMRKQINEIAKLENVTPATTPSFTSKAVDFIKSNSTAIIIGAAIAGVGIALTLAFEKIKSIFMEAFDGLKEFGGEMIDSIKDFITGSFDSIKKFGGETYDKIKDSITGAYDNIKDFGNIAYDKIGESITSISNNVIKAKDDILSLISPTKGGEPDSKLPEIPSPPSNLYGGETYTTDNKGSADTTGGAQGVPGTNTQISPRTPDQTSSSVSGQTSSSAPVKITSEKPETPVDASDPYSKPGTETGTTPSRNERGFTETAGGAVTGMSRGPSRSPGTKGQATLGMSTTENQNQQLFLQAMNDLGVTDPKTRAAMAATVEGESGFKLNTEFDYSRTSNENIIKSFGKGSAFGKMSDEELTKLKADPAKFFDYVYGGRYGNTEPGDGYKYRGRGLIGITFKGNYEKYGKILGVDLVGNPDLANDPLIAAKIAVLMMKDGMAKNQGADIYTQVARSIGNANEVTEDRKKTAYERNLASGQFGADKKADLSFASTSAPINTSNNVREGRGVGPGHDGIDIAAPTGTPVQSINQGKVIAASFEPRGYSGYGNIVVVESLSANGDKIYTKYAHLSAFDVRVGDTVEQGAKLGAVGNTGRSSGPHLHYEMRKDNPVTGQVIDPKKISSLVSPMDYNNKQSPGANPVRPNAVRPNATPVTPSYPQAGGSGGSTGRGSANQLGRQQAAAAPEDVYKILLANLLNGSGYSAG